jgi:hypothetical protein
MRSMALLGGEQWPRMWPYIMKSKINVWNWVIGVSGGRNGIDFENFWSYEISICNFRENSICDFWKIFVTPKFRFIFWDIDPIPGWLVAKKCTWKLVLSVKRPHPILAIAFAIEPILNAMARKKSSSMNVSPNVWINLS